MSRTVRRAAAGLAAVLALTAPLAACSDDADETAGAGEASSSSAAAGDSSGATVELLSPADGQTLLAEQPDAVVLDVRTPEEFASGHLPEAVNIDVEGGNFEAQVGELDKDATYVVYCRTGRRSALAAQTMAGMGFTSLYDLGGIQEWQAAGGEVVTD
ncbi:MAG: rhodanese-like domain-containing protein [Acidimicrobiales bacterium]|jgi:rhodanese-related sulfurtransferase|nr:rhodanese-like domain-containing protein [Acidimicrobiales bacterium]